MYRVLGDLLVVSSGSKREAFLISTHIVKQIVHYGIVIAKMIIIIAIYFSVHILIKTLIPSELYCCNMIIFCKLVKLVK